jgi:hypothetical protein
MLEDVHTRKYKQRNEEFYKAFSRYTGNILRRTPEF